MSQTGKRLLFVIITMTLIGAAYALNYQWLTEEEMTSFGDRIKFWHGDTLEGDVRSNSQIAIMQDPVFYGRVITTEDDFWRGSGYNPQFLGPAPQFNANSYFVGWNLNHLREECAGSGWYFGHGPEWISRILLDAAMIRIDRWPAGTPYDSTNRMYIPVESDDANFLFFEHPIELSGRVAGRVSIGTAYSAGILDNILYVDSDSLTGIAPPNSPNYFALAAEGSIVVLNTPENGRENSGGLGDSQTDPDLTDIVMCGAYYALGGSITFQNQNDPDSGYVCSCQPDDRGDLLTFGGFVQQRRGYFHRATRTSTGYHLRLRWDERLRSWNDGISAAQPIPGGSDTLDYGAVVVGTTVWDTAYVYMADQIAFGGASASYPWYTSGGSPAFGDSFAIPCRFTPPHTGDFHGLLSIYIGGETYQVTLLGEGTLTADDPALVPHDFSLTAFPNPFNSATTIRYSVESSAPAQLIIMDVSGRVVQRFQLRTSPGAHEVRWDANGIATGLYFARLISESDVRVQKLLLLK